MAEAPKKRRSIIISRALPPIPKGPESVSFDKPGVKFMEPLSESATVDLAEQTTGSGITRSEREALKKAEREAEARLVKDEIAADEAMKARRL